MHSFAFMFFLGTMIALTPGNAQDFETSNKVLSDVEFRQIVPDATTIEPSCSETYDNLKSEE